MGTRSATGVRIDGADKLSYNQFDGYGVGQEILTELKADIKKLGLDGAVGTWKQQARSLQLVDEDSKPTPQQIEYLKPYTNLEVSQQSTDDWYCLLRETQGSILKRLNAGYALDGNSFINDSLFCEWGWILNLDDEVLEVYEGFQKKKKPDAGRYMAAATAKNEDGYLPCALIATIPIAELPSIEDMQKHLNKVKRTKARKAAEPVG